MPGVTRLGDQCTGDGCFPPRVNDAGSGDVFVNGIGAHRVGDHWIPHVYGTSVHDGTCAAGSGTVFVNNKALARIGDSISCGAAIAQGSGNVFAGG